MRKQYLNSMYLPIPAQLHTVCNSQLDLIKVGFHYTKRASHSRDSARKSFSVPESLAFLDTRATKFREDPHGQYNLANFLRRCCGFSVNPTIYGEVCASNTPVAVNEL